MFKKNRFKRIVVTSVATFILLFAFAFSIGASDITINRPYPYRMLSCLGDDVSSTGEIYPIAMIYVTGTGSVEPGKYSFIVFTDRFTSYFFDSFTSQNPNGDIYDFWDFCLASDIVFKTSNGNYVTFNTWVSNYSSVRDLIFTQFSNSYGDMGTSIPYNQGFTAGLDVGYSNALNDVDAFQTGLFTIFDAPFQVLREVFSFDLFGINIYSILMVIFTIGLSAFVIRMVT